MIGVVARKELSDHVRDRRSVMGALLMPVIGPLLLLVVFNFIADLRNERPLEVAVVGAELAPDLIGFLAANGAVITDAPADPEKAVVDGDAAVVLRVNADYPVRLADARSAPLQVLVDGSNNKARRSLDHLRQLLDAYDRRLSAQRLIVRGVAPEVAQPLAVREIDLATPQRSTANALGMIPLLLILAALVGGMNIAIDTTAGERERGSLEPLLLNPISRSTLLLGKWLATSVFALGVVGFALLGFLVTIGLTPLEDLGLKVVFGLPEAALMFASLAPLALFGSALQMLVATFARSFKEAQTYLNLLNLLPIIPAMVLMMNPDGSEWWMMLVPSMAQVATITDILRGDGATAGAIALTWASSAVLCAVCLATLTRILDREQTIFGR